MGRTIETLFVAGPVGRIEALLEEPEDRDPQFACLVCHPHPLHGGTMHNKVVYRIARGMRRAGAAVMRFNFRGVNLSEGTHANGIGEIEDARACLSVLRDRYPALPYTLAGFSFGSRVALRLGCSLPGVTRVVAAGFPTSRGEFEYLSECSFPKVFVQSLRDEHGPKTALEACFLTFKEPKKLIWIDAGDHFFKDKLEELEETIVGVTSWSGEPSAESAAKPEAQLNQRLS